MPQTSLCIYSVFTQSAKELHSDVEGGGYFPALTGQLQKQKVLRQDEL